LIDAYQPEWEKPLQNLLTIKGVKPIIFLTLIFVFFILVSFRKNIKLTILEFLLPIFLVSLLNILNVEFYPFLSKKKEEI
jgi:hypothetical protein